MLIQNSIDTNLTFQAFPLMLMIDTNEHLKWFILLIYILLNTTLLIFLRFAIVYGNDTVISSTEVLLSEILKLIISFIGCFVFDANSNLSQLKTLLWYIASEDASDLIKLSIPALLYIIQNNLQYVIETRITLLVIYQFKIITTALFYTAMLNRKIYWRGWLAIIALTVGVSMVEISEHDIEGHYHVSYTLGLFIVIIAIITSGFAGVYFEKVLKDSKSSIWLISIQMSTVSSLLGMIACTSQNTEEISKYGFFYGYTTFTIVVIILQSLVGIMVALVVKYSDNIHKGFVSSLSVALSAFLELFFFNDVFISHALLTGAGLVIVSSFIFVIHTNRHFKNTGILILQQQHQHQQDHDKFITGVTNNTFDTSIVGDAQLVSVDKNIHAIIEI